jgi:subtilisin-like proprotein convertase family protein
MRAFTRVVIVAMLALVHGRADARQTYSVSAAPASLGAIPDGPGACNGPGVPLQIRFVVPPNIGTVRDVRVDLGNVQHTWIGDLTASLVAPGATRTHILFGRVGATTAQPRGFAANLNGPYGFDDAAPGDLWQAAAAVSTVQTGFFRTSWPGGGVAGGTITSMAADFRGLDGGGTWLLEVTDRCAGDVGTVVSATLGLNVTSARNDSYSTPFQTPLGVAAPGVLGNDGTSQGTLSAVTTLASPPSHGTVTLSPNGAFTYTPVANFVGTDSFAYYAEAAGLRSNAGIVSVQVGASTTVQAPERLEVVNVVGNRVRIRWDWPTVGPRPTAYVLSGGLAPGQTLGTLTLPADPTVATLDLPSGGFWLRLASVESGVTSAPSNEIPVGVNLPASPTPLTHLTGRVSGTSIGLAWKSSFGGGAADHVVLDVTGSYTGSVSVPAQETFSANAVPPGTYTIVAHAANGHGLSDVSNTVTLTVPGPCSGPPSAPDPERILAYRSGNLVGLVWDPPASGPAPDSYSLTVTGAFTGVVPLGTQRFLEVPAPAGTYGLSLSAVNVCGVSPPSPVQFVTVP